MDDSQCHIRALPDEILMKIVSHIQPDPERLVPVYNRRFLSVESIEVPLALNAERDSGQRNAHKDVRNFRKTCKRFAAAGEPALFTVIGTRFSKKGLKKLERLIGFKSNVARHVKRFSYLVHYYYPEAERALSSTPRGFMSHEKLNEFQERLDEQKELFNDDKDVGVLAKALKSFTSLQVVKLLPIQDQTDNHFKEYIDFIEGLEGWVRRFWEPSCTRGSLAIVKAWLSANVDLTRLYVRSMNVQSLQRLKPPPPSLSKVGKLAARLTCLTLVFDDSYDMDERIDELSPLFRKVFTSAKNMQAIHVGFPRYRPFDHALEEVFHGVTWPKLLAFGVSGWCLHADEIIHLATRHRERLKGLRLRDVFLKEGSRWKDVLMALRTDMYCLEWLSLRRIGYESFDERMNGGGAEVPDDPDLGSSTDEEEIETDEEMNELPGAGPSQHQTNGHSNGNDHFNGHESSDDEDDEHGPGSNETDFPHTVLNQHATNGKHTPNGRSEMLVDAEIDLEDDGTTVSLHQRKQWEEWVVKR